ncbi:MAG TPA: mechanosensitive ion channel family protein [Candidatus Acidoferrales bacterium]|nr:mechanosensitive ion channel family protein [Candidatus Acidoferrales bacterium]
MIRSVLARTVLVLVSLAGICLSGTVSHAALQPDRDAILAHLNTILNWYRDATANAQPGELPSDAIFQQNVRTLAAQAVQLAFQSARAQAALLGESNGSAAGGAPQNYAQVEERISQHVADDQSQLDAVNKRIPSQSGTKRKNLLAQRDALTGQISLDKAMLDAIQKMSAFVELNNVNKQGLEGSIEELANSVPEVVASRTGATAKKPAAAAAPTTVRSSGLIGELVTLYDQVQSMRRINRLSAESARVTAAANTLRDPLRTAIRAVIAEGQQDLSQTPANATATQTQPQNYAQLTKQFNQVTAALLPLSQEILVLDESRANLEQWRSSISSESKRDLVALLFRVFGIAIALGIVWALSEVWRRLTFRYVHDARRRRQFLLLRRFVMGFFFAMVVVMGFVSEFSSLATYAGFVTAGIAVGLQTLLLSVAAYFFVVGRYGIRIGDRISVAGVTGDVVDVGLVRLYLMELAGTGVDLYPTGRIAVFANSVLFQPTTPLYKQVPGTEYAWHEVSIALTPGGDHKLVENKGLAAVNAVYGEYREAMERQQGTIGDRMEIILKAPAPEAKFQLGDNGPTLLIRYPVPLKKSSEIDDRVAQALIDAIGANEAVKAGISGTPKIRAAVKG